MTNSLFTPPPEPSPHEFFEDLLRGRSFRLERIVSTGQATPPGQWLSQPQAEWVVLLAGAARLRFEDEAAERELLPGDYVEIAPERRHRVEWTAEGEATVWLAVHYEMG